MRIILSWCFCCLGFISLHAQVENLRAYFPFDTASIADALGNPSNDGVTASLFASECGVIDDAISFDGDDEILLPGVDVLDLLSTIDFSIAFYFKPASPNGGFQTILSKRDECSLNNAFAIRYAPNTRALNVIMNEDDGRLGGSMDVRLDPGSCWYHVVVARRGRESLLFVNGVQVANNLAPERLNLINSVGVINIGTSSCASSDANFRGLLDDLRFYNKALTRNEVEDLYNQPDQIVTGSRFGGVKDTTIFVGQSVQVQLSKTCADEFMWSPDTGVSDAANPTPLISPEQKTTYALTFTDNLNGCVVTDSLTINVIDPSEVECGDVFLPNAFTPNDDGKNDTYGISNPFAIQKLISFEIYDRWGSRVFFTDNALGQWDGSVANKPVNPGVFLYKVNYLCGEEEKSVAGSVSVIR